MGKRPSRAETAGGGASGYIPFLEVDGGRSGSYDSYSVVCAIIVHNM